MLMSTLLPLVPASTRLYVDFWLTVMQAVAVASTSQLEQQIEAVWPDGSEVPEDRIKRLAAAYLLQKDQRRCTLSAVSNLLRGELANMKKGGTRKRLKRIFEDDEVGCFKLIPQSDSQFLLELDDSLLLQHQDDSDASDAEDSELLYQEIDEAIAAVWPSSSTRPEDRVRRLAAEYLNTYHQEECYLVRIKGKVGSDLGKWASLGLDDDLPSVLRKDPAKFFRLYQDEDGCDTVQLDTQALLRRAAQAKKQLPPAISTVWPETDNSSEAKVKRAVVEHLLQQPHYESTLDSAGKMLSTGIGSLSSLGIHKGLRKLLQEDPSSCFVLEKVDDSGPEWTLSLDLAGLLQHAQQQQQQQPGASSSQHDAGVSGASPSPGSPATTQPPGASSATPAPSAPFLQQQFELQLQRDESGWIRPSFILHPEQQQGMRQSRQLFGAPQRAEEQPSSPSAGSKKLAGLVGSRFVLEPFSSSSSSNSSSRCDKGKDGDEDADRDAGSDADVAAADLLLLQSVSDLPDDVDEAVWSMAKLLPERWVLLPHLLQLAARASCKQDATYGMGYGSASSAVMPCFQQPTCGLQATSRLLLVVNYDEMFTTVHLLECMDAS